MEVIKMNWDYLHDNPPAAFNPEYREGLKEAIDEAYKKDPIFDDPSVSREERAAAYRALHDRLSPLYPSVREKMENCRK
jgi:hypothetical protein